MGMLPELREISDPNQASMGEQLVEATMQLWRAKMTNFRLELKQDPAEIREVKEAQLSCRMSWIGWNCSTREICPSVLTS